MFPLVIGQTKELVSLADVLCDYLKSWCHNITAPQATAKVQTGQRTEGPMLNELQYYPA
jgi:hypothetical protein